MGRDIEQLSWMSPTTKARAEEKLHEVANKIGYPDKWRDYSTLIVTRGDALGNALQANAFEEKARHCQNRQAGRPWRMGNEPADRERLLQSANE